MPLDQPGPDSQSEPMTDEPMLTTPTFEDALRRLEEIVHSLESGDVPLDRSIVLYQEGETLRQQCEARLKDAQARIDRIVAGPDGVPKGATPLDPV